MNSKNKDFFEGTSILIGTIIGAGILGIPYVISKSGFLIGLAHIVFLGIIITLVHLYIGEIVLRTKKKNQLSGYTEKYLGAKSRKIMDFAFFFSVYSAIIAYIFGVGESISFLIFGNLSYSIIVGMVFAGIMSAILWRGISALKKYEKVGVASLLFLLILIVFIFYKKISFDNLSGVNLNYFFLPFGVILFALLGVYSIPEINLVLEKNKKLMKKIILFGTIIPAVVYAIFAFVVVGFKGSETPEISTLALGPIFITLGILTMSTSYLALGNALKDSMIYDKKQSKVKAWTISAIIPAVLFLIIKKFEYFSFTKILSIGGVISGGIIAIMILLTVKKAKIKNERNPEYSIPINWFLIAFLSAVFVFGILHEIWIVFR